MGRRQSGRRSWRQSRWDHVPKSTGPEKSFSAGSSALSAWTTSSAAKKTSWSSTTIRSPRRRGRPLSAFTTAPSGSISSPTTSTPMSRSSISRRKNASPARSRSGGYDIVGISFIMPNFDKAREMARIVRETRRTPRSSSVGTARPSKNVEQLIDCDHVVKGEGIRWMREHLGQDPDAPINHPALPSAERMSILGVPLLGPASSLLVPGVGCVNGCNFCSTSHFFGKRYTPFLDSGQGAFRDRLPGGRRTRHRQLLRHGRELPQGPRPGPRAAVGDGEAPTLLPLSHFLVGRGDHRLRPRQPGPPRCRPGVDRI